MKEMTAIYIADHVTKDRNKSIVVLTNKNNLTIYQNNLNNLTN